MPNKTVTIHPPVDVPSNGNCDLCDYQDTNNHLYSRQYGKTWCRLGRTPQQCIDACEKEKEHAPITARAVNECSETCPTCGGTEKVGSQFMKTCEIEDIEGWACPDCRPKGEE